MSIEKIDIFCDVIINASKCELIAQIIAQNQHKCW